MVLSVGSIIKDGKNNNYILDSIVGEGGFGYVFKAHRTNDNRIFAVKTMLPSFDSKNEEFAFKNEVESALKVQGDNVIHYEYVHTGDVYSNLPPYIIMEFADGGTLSQLIEVHRKNDELFDNETLVLMFKQLAKAMCTINNTFVHRDIKPENILICGKELKISDFGLSKLATDNTRKVSFKGYGTKAYTAPEAWKSEKNTIQMDIYSMGIVFYELATLSYPYDVKGNNYEEAHLYLPIISPGEFNASLSPSLASIIKKMLEKPIKRRFSNWNEIISILDSQYTSYSEIDKIVDIAVSKKVSDDIARTKEESRIIMEKKDRENFIKMIDFQIENTIVSPIQCFIAKFNSKYAGEKAEYGILNNHDEVFYSGRMSITPFKYVNIKIERIFKENHHRQVYNYWQQQYYLEEYIPQYNRKNILAMGEIKNNKDYGFNIILVDNGDIYGDWFIMENKNNLSNITGETRAEPFVFSLEELPKRIALGNCTDLYSSKYCSFDDSYFLKLINILISGLS